MLWIFLDGKFWLEPNRSDIVGVKTQKALSERSSAPMREGRLTRLKVRTVRERETALTEVKSGAK